MSEVGEPVKSIAYELSVQCEGKSHGSSMIFIDVEQIESDSLVDPEIYGSKQLIIVETDVHERLPVNDWKANGKYYWDHQDICD